MDRAAHQLAEGRIDHTVAGQRQFAAERFGHHQRLEMHAVVALHMDLGAGQALFDQLANGVGGHRRVGVLRSATLRSWEVRVIPGSGA